MTKILPRYLYFQHLQFLTYYLLGGCGIYLLIDVFDRLDNFIKKGASTEVILKYFVFKIPLIIAQILPIVYLLSLITLFFVLKRRNELIALQCGGIHFGIIILLFLLYSFFWSGVELVFSQFLGVVSEKKCSLIWNNLGKAPKKKYIKDLWFREKDRMIYLKKVNEASKKGIDLKIFLLKDDFRGLKKVIKAQKVDFKGNKWILEDVKVFDVIRLRIDSFKEIRLSNMPYIKKMLLVKKEKKVEELNPWQLRKIISWLRKTGTGVDSLLFIWHKKMAYSLSILVLTLFGFCLIRSFDSLFLLFGVALGIVFLLYALFDFSDNLFKEGLVPFWIGAWLADITGLIITGIWFWVERKKSY